MHYKIINRIPLQRRAQVAESDDPRAIFYKALLNSDTYEAYLAALGGNVAVFPKTFGNGQVPVTAEAEYKYVRDRRHWISEFATAPQEIEYSEAEEERLTLRDLASRKAVIQALEEADRLGQDAFLKKYGFKPSREYVLTYEGKKYDSKAIAGAAFQFLYPGAPLSGGRSLFK